MSSNPLRGAVRIQLLANSLLCYCGHWLCRFRFADHIGSPKSRAWWIHGRVEATQTTCQESRRVQTGLQKGSSRHCLAIGTKKTKTKKNKNMLADGGGLSFLEGEKMWIWDDWKNKPYLDLKWGDVFVLNFSRKVTKLLWIIFLSWRAYCWVSPFKCPWSIVLRCISLSEGHGFVRTRTRNSTFLISVFPVRSNRFHPHSSFNIKLRSNPFHTL